MPAAHVLHVVDSLGIGGAELGLVRIAARTLDEFRHSVVCIRGTGRAGASLEQMGLAVRCLETPPGIQWRLPLRLAALFRGLAPDIVHTRNWGTVDAVIAARLARVPFVVHAEHGFCIGDVQGRHNRRRHLLRWLSAGMDRVVAVSDDLQRLLVEEVRIRREKTLVIRDGIDVARFGVVPDRERIRRQLGFGPDDFVIGSVGRLDPVKNFAALVRAAAALCARNPGARLLLVGDGPEAAALRASVTEAGLGSRATLLGHRDDVPELLNAMDVFVLPSFAEGTCNAILEAMATELPVVATRVAGNPELVLHERTGRLFAPDDEVELVEAIASYARNPQMRHRHGAAGRERVLQRYTVEAMVAAYADLYRRGAAAPAVV